MDFMTRLGKEAAYRQSYLTPPKKRTTSHSRTHKLNTEEERKAGEKAVKTKTGNVQPPYRYGRRLK